MYNKPIYNFILGGEKMLGKYVRVKVTQPIGSTDDAGFTYPLNFGTV